MILFVSRLMRFCVTNLDYFCNVDKLSECRACASMVIAHIFYHDHIYKVDTDININKIR